jgi:GGDEF domain-containing protein
MKALVNAITGLPEGELIDEQLLNMLYEHDNWAILTVGLLNLEPFRERYGFVAADDVLRAISLMLVNASREVGDQQDFVAHLEPERFIIITDVAYIDTLSERIQLRVQQSLQYFYPLKDREHVADRGFENALKLDIQKLTIKDGTFDDIEDLKEALGVKEDASDEQARST